MKITFSKQALKDLQKIKAQPALVKKVFKLLELLEKEPLKSPPEFAKLTGDLQGYYSRRINIQHRLVYIIIEDSEKADTEVKVVSMWSHYEF
jgi:Txe/YoeB family toxin of toxin-antitoxin system